MILKKNKVGKLKLHTFTLLSGIDTSIKIQLSGTEGRPKIGAYIYIYVFNYLLKKVLNLFNDETIVSSTGIGK